MPEADIAAPVESPGEAAPRPEGEGTPPKPPEVAAKPPEAPKAPERRKYKLKVDGADVDEELTDEDVVVRLQKARAADKRFQEAADERKRIEAAVSAIKRDPFAALKDPFFNIDLEKQSEERLLAKLQRDMLPEEERKRLAVEEELKTYRQREEEAKKGKEAADTQARHQAEYQRTEKEFLEALELLGSDKDASMLADMATVQLLALENGHQYTPAQLAGEVQRRRAEVEGKAFGRLKGLKGAALAAKLGEEVVQEILRHSVARVKGPQGTQATAPQVEIDEKPKPRRILNESEFKRVTGLK